MSKPGSYFWYELMTTDVAGATDFYGRVVGWDHEDFAGSGMPYVVVKAGQEGVGGIAELPDHLRQAGAPPFWGGYIRVLDVDAEVEAVRAAGGSVHRAPDDIPGVGRFAVVADPQGAMFNLLAPIGEERPAPPPRTRGTAGWHELYTSDEKAALDFYAGRFGWREVRSMDMGPMGHYRVFAWDGADIGSEWGHGGMMKHPQAGAPPGWLFYFWVEDIDAAAQRVRDAGGEVLMGPMQVPDGSWVIQAHDPQGARFALVARKD